VRLGLILSLFSDGSEQTISGMLVTYNMALKQKGVVPYWCNGNQPPFFKTILIDIYDVGKKVR
jgi:hypothetical protein